MSTRCAAGPILQLIQVPSFSDDHDFTGQDRLLYTRSPPLPPLGANGRAMKAWKLEHLWPRGLDADQHQTLILQR
eukprot:4849176-Amphidinium_carterae.1